MGGVAAAKPWHDQAGAQFQTVVDADNRLGRLLDYKIIPNGLFLDAEGRLVGKWIGFSVDNAECVAAVDAHRKGELHAFERAPENLSAVQELSQVEQELYETRVRLGTALRAGGEPLAAATEWKKALLMDPTNYVLRKQIWQILYPERFGDPIDFDWQKEQLLRDQDEEASMRAGGCGPEGCVIPSR